MASAVNSVGIVEVLEQYQDLHYPSGPLYQRINSCEAFINKEHDELKTIYHLCETHSPGLRNKTVLRYDKLLASELKESQDISRLKISRDCLAFKCSTYSKESGVKAMLAQIAEMPPEWTLVQLTPQYNPKEMNNENNNLYYTSPIHISVFSCGQSDVEPFLVTVNAPRDPVNSNHIELAQEVISLMKENIDLLTSTKRGTFKSHKEKYNYMDRRQLIENRLTSIVRVMQDMWLKEWRCLLSGKYVDATLENNICGQIKTYLETQGSIIKLTKKVEVILCCLVKSCMHLKLAEVKKVVQFCFPEVDDKNVIKDIVHFIRNLGNDLLSKNVNIKKHPLILVLQESLDCFPWEMMDVLQDECITRLPSLHFVYCLFKEHEGEIVNGHKIINDYDKGSYIVNPGMDLKSMETRMMTFFNYWTPNWTGTAGYQPTKDEFFELITSSDIFSYNGHGGGSHMMSKDKLQKTHVKAVVLLFGCSSTKIARLDPQVEMFGNYHMYLTARCPCVVGMLWEVTDTDTDTLTTDFLSYWIPSKASVHWKYVDKTKWKKAAEKITFSRNCTEGENHWEPELPRALALARKGLSYNMTKAACVARGLPVKIQERTINES
ncbi:unnamed protein product [Phaedon cochleariae]|uniref:separase n=1 Tax=Phaedon cochleariae TaxID=80249 RepID=A0A9P0GR45_PHACE|nr:unnamed protein product [Phaedon cochleariae]